MFKKNKKIVQTYTYNISIVFILLEGGRNYDIMSWFECKTLCNLTDIVVGTRCPTVGSIPDII